MSGINRAKIGQKLYKQLDRKGLLKEIIIYRDGKNTFGEPQENLYVTTIKGFYHKDKSKLNLNFNDSATVNAGYSENLLVVVNEESKKIKQDDYFSLNNIKYKIIDTGNIEDIVFDMPLNRR